MLTKRQLMILEKAKVRKEQLKYLRKIRKTKNDKMKKSIK